MSRRFATALSITAIALLMAICCTSAFAVKTAPDAYEPNDSPAAAVGPLVGGQFYQGSISAATDVDYFYLNTAGAGAYSISIVDYGDPWSICRKDWTAITAAGDLLNYVTSWGSGDIYGGTGGSSSVLNFATTSAAKVYVRVAGEPNPYCWDVPSYYPGPDKYTIRALPAESIVASLPAPAPPPPSDGCVAAKTAVTKETASIVKLKKSITLHSGKTQKRLKAKLKKTRSDLAKSRKLVTKNC